MPEPMTEEELSVYRQSPLGDSARLVAEVDRLRGILKQMANEEIAFRSEKKAVPDPEDFDQAKAMFALSQLAPMGIEGIAIALKAARLNESRKRHGV